MFKVKMLFADCVYRFGCFICFLARKLYDFGINTITFSGECYRKIIC